MATTRPAPLPYHRRPFCDVVMEGGTTSGVIYPGFIHELARRHRLRSVGGTSAGAIAAAGAAAMELGRVRAENDQDRAEVESILLGLPEKLGTQVGGRTLLARLFAPPAGPRGDLFTILLAAIHPRRSKLVGTLRAIVTSPILGRIPWGAALIAAAMLVIAALSGGAEGWPPVVILALAAAGLLVAWPAGDAGAGRGGAIAGAVLLTLLAAIAIWLDGGLGGGWSWAALGAMGLVGLALVIAAPLEAVARTAIDEIPRNHFGISSGLRPTDDGADRHSLNQYLTTLFDDLAAQAEGAHLTFADLAGGREADPIRLELVTTCLTLERPYRLPAGFADQPEMPDHGRFYFRPDDLADFFPAGVIDALRAGSRGTPVRGRVGSLSSRHLEPGEHAFFPLPQPEDLPVIVAVRLSLSLPLLLSAVPLYRRIPSGIGRDERFLRCWFSDGGLSSNFPIHLFDSALPSAPTFAANLREFGHSFPGSEVVNPPVDWEERVAGQSTNVLLHSESPARPRTADRLRISPLGYNDIDSIATKDERDYSKNGDGPSQTRVPEGGIAAMASFLTAIIGTSRRWRDSIHGPLPGYRDRVVHIGQGRGEGGTNLEMDDDTIKILGARGAAGARKLSTQFLDGAREGVWRQHRWTRARLGLAAAARTLADLAVKYAKPDHADETMSALLADPPATTEYPWPAGEPTAAKRVGELVEVYARDGGWDSPDGKPDAFLDDRRPLPDLDVRIVPPS